MSDIELGNNKFINPYVSDGTERNDIKSYKKYVKSKNKLLRRREKDLFAKRSKKKSDSDSDSETYDELNQGYNLYKDYLHRFGLDGRNMERLETEYINIDSSQRRLEPFLSYSDVISLPRNPFRMYNNTLEVTMGRNHGLEVNDKISIRGLEYVKKTIKVYTTYIEEVNGSNQHIDKYAIDIVRSIDSGKKTFMRFDIDPNMDTTTINSLESTGYNHTQSFFYDVMTNNLKYKEYDINFTDVYVKLSGFRTDNRDTSIGGISLNYLNNVHRVYFAPRDTSGGTSPQPLGIRLEGITDTATHSDNTTMRSFYIKLPQEFNQDTLDLGQYNIDIIFEHYGGIPVSSINSGYPINRNRSNGYHLIKNVYDTKIEIELERYGYYVGNFGENNIFVSKVKNIDTGYSNSNEYVVDLDKIYNNIKEMKISSSVFHDSRRTFRDSDSIEGSNNKLYWQNMDDDDTVYKIEIPEGNYELDILTEKLESLFYSTQKTKKPVSDDSVFTRNNYIKVDIDRSSDIVCLESYKESELYRPFSNINPTIPETDEYDSHLYTGIYELSIDHESHGLKTGDSILIKGSIDILGIPSELINVKHSITSITSDDSYTITIKSINLNNVRRDTRGGTCVKIYTPNMFRLRFDYDDTMGDVLGFRKAGDKLSITDYATIITNDTKYTQEIEKDYSGRNIVIKRNKINLIPYNYVFVSCEELIGRELGKVKNVIGKINFKTGKECNIDTYADIVLKYREPIKRLKTLTLRYYTPNGKLIDFRGMDHSFTIELKVMDRLPLETDIVTGIGIDNSE